MAQSGGLRPGSTTMRSPARAHDWRASGLHVDQHRLHQLGLADKRAALRLIRGVSHGIVERTLYLSLSTSRRYSPDRAREGLCQRDT